MSSAESRAPRPPGTDPLSHLVPAAEAVGLLLGRRFAQYALPFASVAELPGDGYKSACEWYGALRVAKLAGDRDLLAALASKFEPLRADFLDAMKSGAAHVDRYVFGIVPLELYLQTGEARYLALGTETADAQQVTNQTRGAVDDMFMITLLQLQAYRATGDARYVEFMTEVMVSYLGAQADNGLFFHHPTHARVHWGRGNGWFAAGMAEMLRDLPAASSHHSIILQGYRSMLAGLRAFQGDRGLWCQVLDTPEDPSNWDESSCSAMFTFAMIAGVRRGLLDRETYVPVIEAAWYGLRRRISEQGDVSGTSVGTWYQRTAGDYLDLARLTGDGHGQAPVLWVSAALLEAT